VRQYNRAQFAKAIYFVSYYNKRNKYFDEYVGKFFLRDGRRDIDKFAELWQKNQREQGFDLDFWERLQDLHYYKKILKKGKMGSDDKIASILAHKQFFSVPWLVCYKELI
jgi:hypothetical protein